MFRSLGIIGAALCLTACAQGGAGTDAGPPAFRGDADTGIDAGVLSEACLRAGCDPAAICDDSSGSPICTCPMGYTGDGMTCTDIDECAMGAGPCASNATCMNTPGSFSCICAAGYMGDGTTCTDIDECAEGTATCDANADCTNAPGGFSCACAAGFTGDGTSCTDVDECATGMASCDTNATCANEPGTFSCTCDTGWAGDGTSCADVDECAAGTAGCDTNATCTNAPGTFSCACDAGWMGDGMSCSDIDECATGADDCDTNATCTNTPGSWSCACNMGFMGDGRTCTPLGCPTADDFEGMGTTWPRTPWVAQASGGTIVTSPVHAGTYALQDAGWHYRLDTTVGGVGGRLEAWVNSAGGSGRVYLGFGASSGGTRSVVFAPNTNELIIQQNTSFGYSDQSAASVTYPNNTWFRLEADFTGGNTVRATVYNTGGSVVATTTHTFGSSNSGGIAIRSFSGLVVDDIAYCP